MICLASVIYLDVFKTNFLPPPSAGNGVLGSSTPCWNSLFLLPVSSIRTSFGAEHSSRPEREPTSIIDVYGIKQAPMGQTVASIVKGAGNRGRIYPPLFLDRMCRKGRRSWLMVLIHRSKGDKNLDFHVDYVVWQGVRTDKARSGNESSVFLLYREEERKRAFVLASILKS